MAVKGSGCRGLVRLESKPLAACGAAWTRGRLEGLPAEQRRRAEQTEKVPSEVSLEWNKDNALDPPGSHAGPGGIPANHRA